MAKVFLFDPRVKIELLAIAFGSDVRPYELRTVAPKRPHFGLLHCQYDIYLCGYLRGQRIYARLKTSLTILAPVEAVHRIAIKGEDD